MLLANFLRICFNYPVMNYLRTLELLFTEREKTVNACILSFLCHGQLGLVCPALALLCFGICFYFNSSNSSSSSSSSSDFL